MKTQNHASLSARPLFPLMFLMLGICVACSCCGQDQSPICADHAQVTRSYDVVIRSSYEDVLKRMNGVGPTSKLFASQDVELISYRPRKPNPAPTARKEGIVESTIDIQCCSHEFGMMHYLMHLHATETLTVIDVGLVQPVDKLIGQYYRFVIRPWGDHATQINIYHELHVQLEQRRLAFINRIIEKVTFEKTNEKIDLLTPRMVARVQQIASQVVESAPTVAPAMERSPKSPEQAPKKLADQGDQEPERMADSVLAQDRKSKSVPLNVVISGAKSVSGEIRVALYDSQEQFKKNDSTKPEDQQGDVFRSKVIRVTAGNRASLTVTFDDVPPGTYAIGAFHDANDNKKLDTNSIGLPTEFYGFSRNARGMFGPPNYRDATIKFGPENNNFRFNIK